MNNRNPRPETPNTDPSLHPLVTPARSLVEDLGETADEMRQLYTDFGMRPYRVFSIVVKWTGGDVGRGEQQVISETEFLPTPLVDMSRLNAALKSGGRVENGNVRLRELSPRYTEEQITELFHRNPLPKGLQSFVEVREDARDGNTKRRRFQVTGVPERRADEFQWTVELVSAYPDRNRDGTISQPGR